jgi:hypothetical protein
MYSLFYEEYSAFRSPNGWAATSTAYRRYVGERFAQKQINNASRMRPSPCMLTSLT